jgi:hypothetical protein
MAPTELVNSTNQRGVPWWLFAIAAALVALRFGAGFF